MNTLFITKLRNIHQKTIGLGFRMRGTLKGKMTLQSKSLCCYPVVTECSYTPLIWAFILTSRLRALTSSSHHCASSHRRASLSRRRARTQWRPYWITVFSQNLFALSLPLTVSHSLLHCPSSPGKPGLTAAMVMKEGVQLKGGLDVDSCRGNLTSRRPPPKLYCPRRWGMGGIEVLAWRMSACRTLVNW